MSERKNVTQRLVLRGREILPVEGGAPWAVMDARNLLVDGARGLPSAERVVVWSGWMGEGDAERGVWERDFRTWSPEAWKRLEREVGEFRRRVLVRPHARHVLSDAQSCVTFFRSHEHVGLLLDPIAMLTPEMTPRAEEHLERIVGALAGRADAVVMTGGRTAATEWGEELTRGEGLVPRSLVERVVDRLAPELLRVAG